MTKSVYSLLLSDNIIEALDRRAYALGTSRSALANQILAEYLSYITPEKRMHDIFSAMEEMLSAASGFQLLLQPSDSMLSLRTALDYKYNPSIRYSVELFKAENAPIGQLKATLRTQNSELLLCFSQFFRFWHSLEAHFVKDVESSVADGRYIRTIKGFGGRELSPEQQGAFISDYIKLLDSSVKLFFASLGAPQSAAGRIENMYSDFLERNKEVLL